MRKFVWDSSAILNIKELNPEGYSPAYSLQKDLTDGWISGPYHNYYPALAVFEAAASVSRKLRDGKRILREFYLLDENASIYDVDESFISKSAGLPEKEGFNKLRGADLVFACIASVEGAYLVTLDKQFEKDVSQHIGVIDLNGSLESPNYRKIFKNET